MLHFQFDFIYNSHASVTMRSINDVDITFLPVIVYKHLLHNDCTNMPYDQYNVLCN